MSETKSPVSVTVPPGGTPATFGSHLRSEWMIDRSATYLNHGTVGAPPREVIAAQRALQDQIEAQPAVFLLRELADEGATGKENVRMRAAMAPVASYLGVEAGHTAFVDNTTTGANAVFRSFPFSPGDEILVTNLGYGGVTNVAAYAARVNNISLRSIALPGPGAPVHDFVEAIERALTKSTRIIIVDHITASTALVMPLAEIAAVCHANGTLVFVDGAHAPGAIEVDIVGAGVDWYTGNLHKWMWTPRSSGVLWTAEDQREHLHAAVISWGLDNGIAAEFDLPGTRDPSPHLTAPFALGMRARWGEQRILDYTHELALTAGRYLDDRWSAAFETPEAMIGPMVTVALPQRLGATAQDAQRVRDALLYQHHIEVPTYAAPLGLDKGLLVRVSCQVYNDMTDVERLADAIDSLV